MTYEFVGSKEAALEKWRKFGDCLVCGRPARLEFTSEARGVFTHRSLTQGDLDSSETGCLFRTA